MLRHGPGFTGQDEPQAPGSWVLGALLSEAAAVLTTLANVFARRAFTGSEPGGVPDWRQARGAPPGARTRRRDRAKGIIRSYRAGTWWSWCLLKWEKVSQRCWDFLEDANICKGNRAAQLDRPYEDEPDERAAPDARRRAPLQVLDVGLVEVFWKADMWWSFVFRGLGVILWWEAGCKAPVTTVAPLFLAVLLFSNMVCGPTLLREQYRSYEVQLTLVCLLMILAAAYVESQIFNGKMSIRLVNLQNIQNGEGWAITFSIIGFFLAFGYYGWTVIHHQLYSRERFCSDASPFDFYSNAMLGYSSAVPVLSGLLSGATYFEGYLGLPVCNVLNSFQINLQQMVNLVAVLPLLVGSLFCSLEGARRFDCRYFVPASSTVGYLVASFMRILLVGKLNVATGSLVFCLLNHVLLVCVPFLCISRRPASIQLPHTLKEEVESEPTAGSTSTELKSHGTVDSLEMHATPLLECDDQEASTSAARTVIQSFQRIAVLKLTPPEQKTLNGGLYEGYCNLGLWVPAFVVSLALLPPAVMGLLLLRQEFHAWWSIAIGVWCALVTGSTTLRNLVFSSVARRRIRLCMESQYSDVLRAATGYRRRNTKRFGGGRKLMISDPFDSDSSSSEDETFPYEAVQHFVVVETGLSQSYNEFDSEEISELLHSISSASLASTQVSVFFAMKDPKQAQLYQDHVDQWRRAFRDRLRLVTLLKLYECKAGQNKSTSESLVSHLLDNATRMKAPDHLILVTRTTMDSWFHPDYFPAVTFAFQNSGVKRSLTIYQPPILFLKDYSSQRWLTRYACLFLAQSSLASLTDPMGMPLPKSTFTMVLSLLRSIDHRDEQQLSVRPYNIGVWTKCWLSTIGRMNLQPIFLPVYRSGRNPVLDDNFTRRKEPRCFEIGWQMHGPLRAQVLSILELVHMWMVLPLAWYSRRETTLKKRRIFSLMLRSLLPFSSVVWAHWVLSTWFVTVCLNCLCLVHGWYNHWPPEHQKYPGLWDWAFLLGVTAAAFSLPMLSAISHVDLLKLLPAEPPPPPERTPLLQTPQLGRAVSFYRCGSSHREPPQNPRWHYIYLTVTSLIAGPVFFWLSMVEEVRLALTLSFAEDAPADTSKKMAKALFLFQAAA